MTAPSTGIVCLFRVHSHSGVPTVHTGVGAWSTPVRASPRNGPSQFSTRVSQLEYSLLIVTVDDQWGETRASGYTATTNPSLWGGGDCPQVVVCSVHVNRFVMVSQGDG